MALGRAKLASEGRWAYHYVNKDSPAEHYEIYTCISLSDIHAIASTVWTRCKKRKTVKIKSYNK